MHMIRVYRINGDNLSCRFGKDGSLSTAMLITGDQQRNVASQLPGITEANSVEYLRQFGWLQEFDDTCLEIGKVLNRRLVVHGLVVESVFPHADGVALSVIDARFTGYACPVCLFAGIYNNVDDFFKATITNNSEALWNFNEVICDPS